jgi:hypothetical protein
MRAIFAAGFLLALSVPVVADDASYARRGAAELQKTFPSLDVVVVDPLTLKLSLKGQEMSYQLNFDRIERFCSTASPTDCDATLHDFVTKAGQMVVASNEAPDKDTLRAVVRPASYVETLKGVLAKSGQRDTFVTVPLASDLATLCYFDLPTTMRPVLHADIVPLGLTDEQALEVCKANVRKELPPLDNLRKPDSDSFGELKGNPYESSYLALHDDWSNLAESMGWRLIVAAPDADIVLYAVDSDAKAEKNFAAIAADDYAKAERQISASVYRWTSTGWEVITP